jgi:hypothetical protein
MLQKFEVVLGHLRRDAGRAQAYHAAVVDSLPILGHEEVAAACTEEHAEAGRRCACSRLGDTVSMEGRSG